MKNALATVVALIMFVIAGLVAAPIFVDLQGYKIKLVERIKAVTGLDVQVNGDVRVSFFPEVNVVVRNVVVTNVEGATNSSFISVRSISVSPSISSLFHGDLDVQNIVLTNPVLNLERLKDGRKNWDEIFNKKNDAENTKNKRLAPPEKVEVVNGKIVYLPEEGDEDVIDNIKLTINSESINGPFSAISIVDIGDEKLDIFASLGNLNENPEVVFDIKSKDSSFGFKGVYSGGDNFTINGSFNGKTNDLSGFIGSYISNMGIFKRLESKEKINLDGNMLISESAAQFKNIIISSDSISGKGEIEALYKGSDINWQVDVEIDKINLDSLIGKAKKEEDKEKTQEELLEEFYASASSVSGLSKYNINIPKNLKMSLTLFVKEVLYRKEKIHDIDIGIDFFDRRAVINSLSAKLPGDSKAEFLGDVSHNGTRPLLKGEIIFSGERFRKILVWVFPELSFIPEQRLRDFLFRSSLTMTPQKINIEDITASVDRSILTGEVSIRPNDGYNNISVSVNVDRVNLDYYRITPVLFKNAYKIIEGLPDADLEMSWINTFSNYLSSSITISDVTLNSEKIKKISSVVNLFPGSLTLQRFAFNSESSDLAGEVTIKLREVKPEIKIDLKSSRFDADFLSLKHKTKGDISANNPKAPFIWPKEQFNLLGVHKFRGTIDLKADVIKIKDVLFNNAIFSAYLQGNKLLDVKQFNGSFLGGRFDIKGNMNVDPKSMIFALSYAFTNVDLSGFFKLLSVDIKSEGVAYFGGVVDAVGSNLSDIISNLKMSMDFSARKIVVDGFDLDSIILSSKRLFSVIDMQSLVSDAMSRGNTKFLSADGKLRVENGVMSIGETKLATALSRGVFVGKMKLRTFDIAGKARMSFRPEANKKVTLGIDLSGTASEIKKAIDTKELEKYITDKSGS